MTPIHLSGLTASGVTRAIAHGMSVKARVLASVADRLRDALVRAAVRR